MNAAMNNTAAERFNVAGAMVVKLFGKPRLRARRVRRTAPSGSATSASRARCTRAILFVGLGLVASVGTAVVYYLGGRLAISGAIVDRDHRRLRRLREPDLHAAHPAHERSRRRAHRAGVVRARLRGARLRLRSSRSRRTRATSPSRPGGSRSTTCGSGTRPPRCRPSRRSRRARGPRRRGRARGSCATSRFTVEPGETVALVGPSGAGKTTTAMLVPRIARCRPTAPFRSTGTTCATSRSSHCATRSAW